jgi:tRNA threonylcarbamoyladenosine biosynthesis protein TsaE
MDFPLQRIVSSEDETRILAEELAKHLTERIVVLLNGELGTGKTFFIKAVCNFLGVDSVSSPSFAIVNEYRNNKKIIHFDFYRIKNQTELYDIGFEEYLTDDAIIFIEWANMFPEILPKQNLQINLEFINNNSRNITIRKNG